MKYTDLPQKMRDQVDAKLADQDGGRRRPSRASTRAPMAARCECGTTFTNENQLNQHPAGPGHTRVETSVSRTADADTT